MIPELLFLPPSGAEWGSLADIALQLILDERTRKGESEGRECGGSRPSHVLGLTPSTALGSTWCFSSGGGQLSAGLKKKVDSGRRMTRSTLTITAFYSVV